MKSLPITTQTAACFLWIPTTARPISPPLINADTGLRQHSAKTTARLLPVRLTASTVLNSRDDPSMQGQVQVSRSKRIKRLASTSWNITQGSRRKRLTKPKRVQPSPRGGPRADVGLRRVRYRSQ